MNCFVKIIVLCALLGILQVFAGEEKLVRPFIEAREHIRTQQQNLLKNEGDNAPGSGEVVEAGKGIASPNAVRDELRKEELLNNAGAVMYSKHREEWNALVLVINSSYELEDAFETVITPSSFSPSNWKICTIIGEQLIQRGK